MDKKKAELESWQAIIAEEKMLRVPFFSLCFPTLNCGREKTEGHDSQPLKDL